MPGIRTALVVWLASSVFCLLAMRYLPPAVLLENRVSDLRAAMLDGVYINVTRPPDLELVQAALQEQHG